MNVLFFLASFLFHYFPKVTVLIISVRDGEKTNLFLVLPIPIIPFDSQSTPIPLSPEQLWFDLNDLQRKLYSCYSTGNGEKNTS